MIDGSSGARKVLLQRLELSAASGYTRVLQKPAHSTPLKFPPLELQQDVRLFSAFFSPPSEWAKFTESLLFTESLGYLCRDGIGLGLLRWLDHVAFLRR